MFNDADRQQLNDVRNSLDHQHDLLHLILRLQGINKQQIEMLLAAHDDDAAWASLIGQLKKPTEALAAAVKANQ